MTEPEQAASSSILPGLFGITFVILKLCHVIAWSWWWVTLPFWICPAIGIAAILVVAAVVFAVTLLKR